MGPCFELDDQLGAPERFVDLVDVALTQGPLR